MLQWPKISTANDLHYTVCNNIYTKVDIFTYTTNVKTFNNVNKLKLSYTNRILCEQVDIPISKTQVLQILYHVHYS